MVINFHQQRVLLFLYTGLLNFYYMLFTFYYIRYYDLQPYFKFLSFITIVNILWFACVEFIFLDVLVCCSLCVIHGDVSYNLVNCFMQVFHLRMEAASFHSAVLTLSICDNRNRSCESCLYNLCHKILCW